MTGPNDERQDARPKTASLRDGGLSCFGPKPITRLRKRADFLRAARARRAAAPGFVLQARKRRADENLGDEVRVGFTCSKKVGNAVARNRAKRRLRALAQTILPTDSRTGWDYVLIGRAGATAAHPMSRMERDLRDALAKLHGKSAGS